MKKLVVLAVSDLIQCTRKFGCFLILAIALPATTQAQWSVEPIVRVGAEKDDNATLTFRTDNISNVNGFLYDLSARLNYESALTHFHFTPRLLSRNYSKFSELDSNDIFVQSVLRHDTRSGTFDIRLNYEDQTVRRAERADSDLDVDDPGDIPDDGAGSVGRLQGNRQKFQIAPKWEYRFSGANSMSLDLNYVDAAYDGEAQQFLSDYTDLRFGAALERDFSERTTGIIRATTRRYELDDGSNRTTGVGIMAGFDRDLSPTTVFSFLVGMEDTSTSISKPDPTPIADISLRRRLQTIDILAQYRRSISASGVGRVSTRDSFNLNVSRLLSEKVTAGIGVRAYQTNSLDNTVDIDERNFVQLRSQFIWNITTTFSAEVDYRYTFQKRSTLPESSNSNQVELWFSYQPNSGDRRFQVRTE